MKLNNDQHFIRLRLICGVLFVFVLSLTGCGSIGETYSYSNENEDKASDLEAEGQIRVTPVLSESIEISDTEDKNDTIYVQVCGMVRSPGVYELKTGDRVYMAIEKAGGLSQDAAADAVNQAEVLTDGQMVRIPDKKEWEELKLTGNAAEVLQESGPDDGLIDINSADEAMLTTLPGIGEAKARSIIEYRNSNGSFKRIEDIKNVSGIGNGLYEKIRDRIRAG